MFPTSIFRMGMLSVCHCVLVVCSLPYILHVFAVKRLPRVAKETLDPDVLNSVGIVKDCGYI